MDAAEWRGKYTHSLYTMVYADMPRTMIDRLIAANRKCVSVVWVSQTPTLAVFKELGRKLEKVIGAKFAQYALVDAPKELGNSGLT